MDAYGWMFVCVAGLLFSSAASGILIVWHVLKNLRKEHDFNFDWHGRRFLYRVSEPPEEIFAGLKRGDERETLRYDYDPFSKEIRFYWHGTMHGEKTTYTVDVFERGGETMLLLYGESHLSGRGGVNKEMSFMKRLEKMNLFWQRVAGAQPIPYDKYRT